MANKHLSAIVSLTSTSVSLQNIIKQLLFIFWQYSVLMIKKSLFKTLYEHKQTYSELWCRAKKDSRYKDGSQENISRWPEKIQTVHGLS